MMKIFFFSLIFLGLGAIFLTNNISFAGSNNLSDVRIRYCNDTTITWGTKTLKLKAEAGKPTPICIYLLNMWAEEVSVKVNFVDGTITQDSYKKKACKQEREKDNFWQRINYIESWQVIWTEKEIWTNTDKNINEKIFTLTPQSITKKTFSLNLPDGYAGKIYWCSTLSIAKKETENSNDNNMFTVINRIWFPIEVIVKWDIILDLHYQEENKEKESSFLSSIFADTYRQKYFAIQKQINKEEWEIGFILANSGNITQEANYKISLKSFSHQDTIITGDIMITPGEEVIATQKISIPWWDFLLNTKIETEYKPVFDFESDAITGGMKKIKHLPTLTNNSPIIIISQTMKYLVWWLLGIILVLIIILKIRKIKK